ncbi:MAG: site-2 protease family protein [Clostridiales bacterium]|jgi:Zn-dependent protease|nr:site-2 protease family protein [Clostridiales bacterium]
MLWLYLQGVPLRICLLYLVILLFSATIHEISHAWVAFKLGDPTARNLGRITLDPRVHLTQMGLFAILLLPIGWANPVPINPRNFRNYKRDTILVSLAGPLSNLLLAFVSLLVYFQVLQRLALPSQLLSTLGLFCVSMAEINVLLMVFNLIPFPPLDGSKILTCFLPYRTREFMYRMEHYGIFVLFLIINVLSPIMRIAQNAVIDALMVVTSWI